MNYLKKSNHGITLVALVITIIVLLVLATIVTKVAIDSGPLKTARRANDSYIIKSEKAEITIGYHNYQEAKDVKKSATLKVKSPSLKEDGKDGPTAEGVLAHVGGDEISGWTIHFTDTQHTYSLDRDGNITGPFEGEDPGPAEETNPTTGGGGTTDPEDDPTPTEEPEQPTDTTWRDNGDGTYTKNGVTIAIGDYVDYTYDTANAYSLSKSYSGYTSNQSIAQDATASKWRILNVNIASGTVDLISEYPTVKVYFNGATGYNNGVYLLNKMCEWLYSNKTLGITARSIKIEDIEAQMNATGLAERKSTQCTTGTEPDFGATKTFSGTHTYYPYLYAQEKGSGINSSTVRTDGINQSDPYYSYPTSSAATRASGSKLTVTQTGYTLYHLDDEELDGLFKNNRIRELVFPEDVYTYYWLATRAVTAYNGEYVLYGLFLGGRGGVSAESLYGSYPYDYSMPRYLRPIVTVNADWIGATGGTSSNPRSLTVK